MNLLHLLIAALLAVNHPALAVQRDAATDEEEAAVHPEDIAWSKSFAASLRASDSPRERALGTRAVELEPGSDAKSAARGRQLREAAEAAPTDALVQSMWAVASGLEAGCDARSPCPERRFAQARAEPENALAWIPTFPGADAKASETEIQGVLEKIATAERADDHFAESTRAWNDIYSAQPLPLGLLRAPSPYQGKPRKALQAAAIAQAAAMLFGNWQPLLKACRSKEPVQAPARRFDLCAQAGRGIMRNGTSFVTESLGFALLRNSGLATTDDRLARRRSQWRQQAMIDLGQTLNQPREFDLYFQDLLSTGVEARAVELLMQRNGVSIEPPAAWQAPSSGD